MLKKACLAIIKENNVLEYIKDKKIEGLEIQNYSNLDLKNKDIVYLLSSDDFKKVLEIKEKCKKENISFIEIDETDSEVIYETIKSICNIINEKNIINVDIEDLCLDENHKIKSKLLKVDKWLKEDINKILEEKDVKNSRNLHINLTSDIDDHYLKFEMLTNYVFSNLSKNVENITFSCDFDDIDYTKILFIIS